MKSFALAFFLSMFCLGCAAQDKRIAESQTIPIEEVMRDVQDALASVQTKLVNAQLPPLQSVTLALQAAIVNKGGGNVKFVVISLGASRENTTTQRFEIVLVPPKPGSPKDVGVIREPLENALLAAAQGARDAEKAGGGLKVSSLSVKLAFAVKTAGSGGVKLELLPITLDVGGEASRTTTQELTVSYAHPK